VCVWVCICLCLCVCVFVCVWVWVVCEDTKIMCDRKTVLFLQI